jgi:hypothetical protein
MIMEFWLLGGIAKPEIATPVPPFMILKDFPEGVWRILQDHGSTVGGTAVSP